MNYFEAVHQLVGGEISGNDTGPISEFVFHNGQTPPTEEQIQAKIAELKAEYEANEYQRQRAAEYPSWQDQLDKIYHDGVMSWQKEIKAIKEKYPKPDQA